MKRILLFVLTNLAVIVLLGITTRLLGVDRFLTQGGINMPALFGFAAVFGMGGSFISLLMSKWMAKMSTGARVIEQPGDATERWLLETVRAQAQRASIAMPEVAIYDAAEPNAFATGPSRNNSLVAVSSGLLHTMNRDEVEAILGHEVSHIANGDMVTLTLIQGVVNTFVIAFARIIGFMVDRFLSGDRDEESSAPGMAYWISSMVAELILGFLASAIVLWFSRQREFRADSGGAQLAGRDKMISALERLQTLHEPAQLPSQMAAFGVRGGTAGALGRLFMSHPPIEERIAALRSGMSA